MDPARNSIVVVGPGAMGSLFAGLLGAAGFDVGLLGRNPERAGTIAERGIVIERGPDRKRVKVPVFTDPRLAGTPRLAVICVKAYDTAAAARSARPLVGRHTDVLSLQNGIGNVEALAEVFGAERVLAGTTAQGANLVAAGHVRHAGVGETVIAAPDRDLARARAAADIFNRAGIATTVSDDLAGLVWSKLAINAAINPLTAILGVKNGALPQIPAARDIMARVSEEIIAVCERLDIRLLHEDPGQKAIAVAVATAENVSSMLADVRARRRTEVGQINGAVAARAEAAGVPAPVNRTLDALVRAIEASYGEDAAKPA